MGRVEMVIETGLWAEGQSRSTGWEGSFLDSGVVSDISVVVLFWVVGLIKA